MNEKVERQYLRWVPGHFECQRCDDCELESDESGRTRSDWEECEELDDLVAREDTKK